MDAYYGSDTKNLTDNWGILESKRDEAFVKIIVGEAPLSDFDEVWLAYWETQGGKAITEEVNAWYAER